MLLKLKDAAAAARDAGHARIDPALLAEQDKYFTDAAQTGIVLNAARRSTLEKKRHALANRMRDRAGDYLRFAYDLRVPFDNNPAEVRHEVARGEWAARKEGRQMALAAG